MTREADRTSVTEPDRFDQLRDVFKPYVSRTPADSDLWRLAYLLDLHDAAPAHGEVHRRRVGVVRSLLGVLPDWIADADAEVATAGREGRTTDADYLARRLRTLQEEAESLRPLTARRDHRGAWHGWARLMRYEVQAIVGDEVSFAREDALGVEILANLISKLLLRGEKKVQSSQVFEALRPPRNNSETTAGN